MTVYERLCAYVSPEWYNYQDILDKRYEICESRISRSLPLTCTDSYLGRLVDLSVTLNETTDQINATNFDAWQHIICIIIRSKTITARPLTSKVKTSLKEYLRVGFPSAWVMNLFEVFRLSLYTARSHQPLNKIEYLDALKAVYAVRNTYLPVAIWFQNHPQATEEKSLYKEE